MNGPQSHQIIASWCSSGPPSTPFRGCLRVHARAHRLRRGSMFTAWGVGHGATDCGRLYDARRIHLFRVNLRRVRYHAPLMAPARRDRGVCSAIEVDAALRQRELFGAADYPLRRADAAERTGDDVEVGLTVINDNHLRWNAPPHAAAKNNWRRTGRIDGFRRLAAFTQAVCGRAGCHTPSLSAPARPAGRHRLRVKGQGRDEGSGVAVARRIRLAVDRCGRRRGTARGRAGGRRASDQYGVGSGLRDAGGNARRVRRGVLGGDRRSTGVARMRPIGTPTAGGGPGGILRVPPGEHMFRAGRRRSARSRSCDTAAAPARGRGRC